MSRFAFAAALLTATLAAPLPAAAQSENEKVNLVIVYGDDACPQSTGDDIVVCARKDEAERFRIPPALRDNPNDLKNEAWANRVAAYEYVGRGGIASCSPDGPGGSTGCTQQLINAAYKERAQGSDVQAGRLIEQERQRRLASIDAEAEKTEAEVRKIEEERAAREAAQQEAEQGAAAEADAVPTPQ